MLDMMSRITIFSKIDICVCPGDEWKTTFKMKDGMTHKIDGFVLQDVYLFLSRSYAYHKPLLENFLFGNCMSMF